MKHVVRLLPYVLVALVSTHAYGSGALIGPFWLDGVKATEHPDDFVDDNDGRWIRVDYEYAKGAVGFAPRAYFTVFSKPVVLDGLPTSQRVANKAQADEIGIIVAGELRQLKLTAYVLHSATGRELWIEHSQLLAELGYVTSGLQKIAGGTRVLKGSRLWVKNLTEFRTRRADLQGTFELTTWNRTLSGAQLAFAGGCHAVATLVPDPNDQNVVLQVDMSAGRASLWNASFRASNVTVAGNALIGPATLSSPQLLAKNVRLAANKGALSASLGVVGGKAQAVKLPSEKAQDVKLPTCSISFEAGATDVSWATAVTSGTHDTEVATFQALDVEQGTLVTQSASARLFTADETIVAGVLSASNVSLSSTSLKGTFDWTSPEIPPLTFLIPKGDVRHVSFALEGNWKEKFTLSGALDSDSFLIGGIRLDRQTHLAFDPTSISEDIKIPISLNVGAQGGRIEVSDGTKTVILTAALNKLLLKGTFVLTVLNLEQSHLDIPQNNLQVEFTTAVSTTPWLGSTKPLFASATLKASNHSDLVVGVKKQTGLVLVDTDALAIGDPVVEMGGAKPFRARTTLNALGEATFAYCLNRGNLVLTKGTFHAANAEFKSLDPGAVVDIGGTMLVDPAGSIDDLAIEVDRVNNKGSVMSGAIKMGGSHVSRTRPPGSPNDLAFDGTPNGQLSVDSLGGTPEFTATKIGLTDLHVRGLALAMNTATLDVSEAISLTDASVSVKGDEIVSSLELKETDSDVPTPVTPQYLQLKSLEDVCNPLPTTQDDNKTKRREYFTNVSVEGSGRLHVGGAVDDSHEIEVHLANAPLVSNASIRVSGRSDRLDGKGSAQLDAFAGAVDSAIKTDASCAPDGGNQNPLLRIPMKTGIATTATTMTISLVRGKAEAKGPLIGLALAMVSTGKAECEGSWHKQVLVAAQSGWTDGICPTWSEPFRHCRWTWETPEVSYEYRTKAVVRVLTATVTMTNPYVQLGGKKMLICNVGPARVGPVGFIGGYYPEFRGNIPLVSDGAKALVGGVAETAETGNANVLGNSVAGLATLCFDTPLGPVGCIAKGFLN